MYDFIDGQIQEVTSSFIVVMTKEIGYKLNYLYLDDNPQQLVAGMSVRVYIALFHHEMQSQYFAFISKILRDCFQDLINIKTVGPKTGASILRKFRCKEFYKVVEEQDVDRLTSIRGIGWFTAKLILEELNQKYFGFKLLPKQEKVIETFQKMGYKRKDIYKALLTVDKNLTLEALTKEVLFSLSQQVLAGKVNEF